MSLTPSRNFTVKWIDRGRAPTQRPDPMYPRGVDVDTGQRPACSTVLPYPAPRVGMWWVECRACGTTMLVTAAGRQDDPRSVAVACKQTTAAV